MNAMHTQESLSGSATAHRYVFSHLVWKKLCTDFAGTCNVTVRGRGVLRNANVQQISVLSKIVEEELPVSEAWFVHM